MIQRASVADPRLQRIADAIAEQIRPARIVLFGSRARGDARPDSDYDLFVEMEFDDFRECHNRVSDVTRAAAEDCEFDIILARPGVLEARRNDPGYVEWDVARDGVVVYPPGASSDALRPPRDTRPLRVRESEPPASIAEWLSRAADDLRTIDHTLAAGEAAAWIAACFHAQQAAEKYLKVLLIRAGVHPPKTHNLDEIVERLRGLGYELPDLTAECAVLTPYAVEVRYPGFVAIPDEATARIVLAAGRRIVDLARAYIR